MKKNLIVCMAVFSLFHFTGTVNAMSIDVSMASIGIEDYAVEGALTDNGDFGIVSSIDCAFFCNFNFDATEYFDDQSGSTLNYSGVTPSSEPYNYEFNLSTGQFAWGAIWNWTTPSPVLILFDCGAGNPGDACSGSMLPMQELPFPGESWSFNGVVSASTVPVPSAIWLFSSGLIGLIGMTRRKA